MRRQRVTASPNWIAARARLPIAPPGLEKNATTRAKKPPMNKAETDGAASGENGGRDCDLEGDQPDRERGAVGDDPVSNERTGRAQPGPGGELPVELAAVAQRVDGVEPGTDDVDDADHYLGKRSHDVTPMPWR